MKKKFHVNLFPRLSFAILLFVFLFCLGIVSLLLSSYVLHDPIPTKKIGDVLPAITVKAQLITSNLQAPLDMVFPGNGDILVAEQSGRIRLIKNGRLRDSSVNLIE